MFGQRDIRGVGIAGNGAVLGRADERASVVQGAPLEFRHLHFVLVHVEGRNRVEVAIYELRTAFKIDRPLVRAVVEGASSPGAAAHGVLDLVPERVKRDVHYIVRAVRMEERHVPYRGVVQAETLHRLAFEHAGNLSKRFHHRLGTAFRHRLLQFFHQHLPESRVAVCLYGIDQALGLARRRDVLFGIRLHVHAAQGVLLRGLHGDDAVAAFRAFRHLDAVSAAPCSLVVGRVQRDELPVDEQHRDEQVHPGAKGRELPGDAVLYDCPVELARQVHRVVGVFRGIRLVVRVGPAVVLALDMRGGAQVESRRRNPADGIVLVCLEPGVVMRFPEQLAGTVEREDVEPELQFLLHAIRHDVIREPDRIEPFRDVVQRAGRPGAVPDADGSV